MFRKLANIFVLILFVVSTTGFTISKHYCHGNLVSVAINAEAESCCGSSNNGCCENENEFYQLNDDFTASQNSTIDESLSFELISYNIDNELIIEVAEKTNFTNTANGPPFKDRQFLYYIHQFKLAPPIC